MLKGLLLIVFGILLLSPLIVTNIMGLGNPYDLGRSVLGKVNGTVPLDDESQGLIERADSVLGIVKILTIIVPLILIALGVYYVFRR